MASGTEGGAMTAIKSICSGIGALSAVLICASVLWSEMGDLHDEKLDKEMFVQYREDTDKKIDDLADSNRLMTTVIGEIQMNVREIKTLLEERTE